jgi:2-polyprenyl-3-methyl-5-hydroxy-6-metoxy-1,4-benzoquinol methylase
MPLMSEINQRQLAHDRIADRFDDLMNEYDVARRLQTLIEEFLADVDLSGLLVLDAGCGTGRGTQALANQRADMVSLDLGFNLVKYTAARFTTRPLAGSVIDLPFADDSFDVVFSTEVIEHTPDPLAAAAEMYRVLKPGGHLVLSTPGWLWQFPVRLASWLKVRPYDGLENFVKAGDLRGRLAGLGAEVVKHKGIHLLPFQLGFLHPFLRYTDRFGEMLLPVMINQCIHCRKPARA